MIAHERVRYHLERALATTESDRAGAHVQAALQELEQVLAACPRCGVVGLPERIREHECQQRHRRPGPDDSFR